MLYHTLVKCVEHNRISCVLCQCEFLALKTLISDEELKFSDESLTSVETFTFEPSDPPKRIEIVVLDDEVVEATETHLIRLRVPKGETGVNLPRDSVDISVLDDGDSEWRL